MANYTYTYDSASRVTSEKLNGSTTSYQYDNTNQLTDDAVKSYSYDSAGNRTMSGYTTGTGNRLTNDGVYTYTYDDEGNLTKKSKGASAETWTYTYDNRNQLVGVTERATDSSLGTLLFEGTYTYDVFNERVQADEYVNGSGTTTTKSVYADVGTVFADLTSGNAMQTRYLRQDDSQYSPVVARLDGSGNALWNLDDRLNSTRNVVNGSGTVVDTITYDGYGNITAESDSTKTGEFTFTGLRNMRNAGLLEAANRVYDPSSGRWLEEDPIRWQAGDENLRRYVGNGPTDGTDRRGLQGLLQQPPAFVPQMPRADEIAPNVPKLRLVLPDLARLQFQLNVMPYAENGGQASVGFLTAILVDVQGWRRESGDQVFSSIKQFRFTRPPNKEGWIIQHVIMSQNGVKKAEYWEGWEVDKQGTVFGGYRIDPTTNQPSPINTLDWFRISYAPDDLTAAGLKVGSKGNFQIIGYTKFLPGYNMKWKVDAVPQAKGLPASVTGPTGWDDNNAIVHKFTVRYEVDKDENVSLLPKATIYTN